MRAKPITVHESNHQAARSNLSSHSFTPGVGYLQHGAPPLAKPGSHAADRCAPPPGTADGSFHLLRVAAGGREMTFRWVAAEQAWARLGGLRMAFKAAYLSQAGWVYSRARN